MRKNRIPIILIWVLYGLAAGICLFLVTMSIGSGLGFGMIPGLIAGLVLMFILGLLVRGIHQTVQKIMPKNMGGKKQLVPVIVESILFLLCLVGMVSVRLMSFPDAAADPVFEMAKVTEEGFTPATSHGGMLIYLWFLHGTMVLLGNKAFAAMGLQLFLLVCAVFGIYFGVRRLSGPVVALVSVAFVGFAPYMLAETAKLTPFLFFLIFYGLAVGSIAALPERMNSAETPSGKVLAVLYYLVVGMLIGFCCYLDAAGITLLIFLTGVICFGGESADREQMNVWGNSVLVFVCCVLAAALGYVASHGIRCLGGGSSLADSVYAQMGLYLPDRFQIPVTVGSGVVHWDVPVLVILMALGVFGFWCSQRIRDKAMWLFAAALLLLMQCFGMNSVANFNAYALLYLFCTVMAGCSVADLFTVTEQGRNSDQELPDAVNGWNTVPLAGWDDADDIGGMTGMVGGESPEVPKAADLEILDLQSETAPVINYIENPLPLPKKKVHRVLDYDYEVADDDDFDIP